MKITNRSIWIIFHLIPAFVPGLFCLKNTDSTLCGMKNPLKIQLNFNFSKNYIDLALEWRACMYPKLPR